MYPYQQFKARFYAIPAVIVSMLAALARQVPAIYILLLLIAAALSIKACYHLSIAKGHDPFLALLGLLTIPGLIIASLLPDHHPEVAAAIAEAVESGANSDDLQATHEK
jgi:hypothetical protein